MKRITIHIGHYGSGKTELSLHRAIALAKTGEKVTLVDLDIVNPYFRSGEHEDLLRSLGVKVIKPNFEGSTVSVPSLPASVQSVFADKDSYVIFDVGGDPSGATALGRYKSYFENEDVETVCIINTLRPFTNTTEDICHMMDMLTERSRLAIDAIISNTNLAYDTTTKMLMDGHNIIKKAAEVTKTPIIGICGMANVLSGLPVDFEPDVPRIELELHMRPEWLDD